MSLQTPAAKWLVAATIASLMLLLAGGKRINGFWSTAPFFLCVALWAARKRKAEDAKRSEGK